MQKHEEKKLLSEVRNAMVDNDNQNYMIWKTMRLGKKIKLQYGEDEDDDSK